MDDVTLGVGMYVLVRSLRGRIVDRKQRGTAWWWVVKLSTGAIVLAKTEQVTAR